MHTHWNSTQGLSNWCDFEERHSIRIIQAFSCLNTGELGSSCSELYLVYLVVIIDIVDTCYKYNIENRHSHR